MKLWQKASILPLIVLILYGLSVWNMIHTENKLVNLYNEHTLLLEKLQGKGPAEKQELLNEFADEIELTRGQQIMLNISHTSQKAIDRLTPGKEHCLTSDSENCLVYNGNIITAAQNRHNALLKTREDKPLVMNVLNGTAYSTYDYIAKALTLAIEAAVVSILIITFFLTLRMGEKNKK